jgi:hypothetical protein
MKHVIWRMEERPNGSVEIQDTLNNNAPIADDTTHAKGGK